MNNKVLYTIFGIVFGCCFPIGAYFLLDKPNILFGIILTAPVFLGAFAFVAGLKADNIEDQVLERTNELKKSQLETENALKVKSKFLATMSHEIRTPLNGILSCVTILKNNVVKPENILLLNTVSESGQTLLTLINDVLDLSKIEAGKLNIEKSPFDILRAAKQTYKLYKGNTKGTNVSFEVLNEEDFKKDFNGDVIRFKQILSNLVDNGIKFSNESVDIKLWVEKTPEDENDKVWVSVKDDGIGISTENQKRLFRDFVQATDTTTKDFGGTGLGLSICKTLIEQMDGEIFIDSRLGEGAVFRFYLCLESVDRKVQTQEDIEPQLQKGFALKNPLNILVVEDNRINQLVIKKILGKLGYEVIIKENGKESVELLRQQRFDLIFMDMNMPIMNGLEATSIIRNELKLETKIVALTANAFYDDRQKCLDVGMNDFLSKPINLLDLTNILIETYSTLNEDKSA